MTNYLEMNDVSIEPIRDAIVRIRISPPGTAQDSLLNRYGFIADARSEEHTSELQSHSFISYAVFCLKKKKLKITLTDLYTA